MATPARPGHLPVGSASVPATDRDKASGARAARWSWSSCAAGCVPRHIMTRERIENAIAASRRPAGPPTLCCTCWPSRGKRRRARRSTTSTHQRAHAAHADLKPRGRSSRRPDVRGGTPLREAAARRARLHGDAIDRDRPDHGRGRPRRSRRRPGGRPPLDRPLKRLRRVGDPGGQPRARRAAS